MKLQRNPRAVLAFTALLLLFGADRIVTDRSASAQAERVIPLFEVDPLWPKPLPNRWIMGSVVWVAVDSLDHVWLIHQQSTITDNERAAMLNPPLSECCVPAPPILVFDQKGTLVKSWGGPGAGYDWPQKEHGIHVDHKGYVWIAGMHVLKFTQDGRFLLQIGAEGESGGSNDTEHLNRPTAMVVDPSTNEVYVADGLGNRRVVVFDADTGASKRHWGAYGNRPDDTDPYNSASGVVSEEYDSRRPSKQFGRAVHDVASSKDGLVYVADRVNDRIQVFQRDGHVRQRTLHESAHARVRLDIWISVFGRSAPGISL